MSHHDINRPGFGYTPDPESGYGACRRAQDAQARASSLRDGRACRIADQVVNDLPASDFERHRYRQAVAGQRYAEAVASVEYDKATER